MLLVLGVGVLSARLSAVLGGSALNPALPPEKAPLPQLP